MSIKNDVNGLIFKRFSKEYITPICDYCNNHAIGTYINESDERGFDCVDVCEECYKKIKEELK